MGVSRRQPRGSMHFRLKPPLLLLAFLSLPALILADDVAITGARIEIGNGSVIAAGTVVIHDGLFVAVGENVAPPPGAQIIDGKGLVVYPGFIDAYTTSGLKLPSAPTSERAPDSRNTAPATMWHGNRKGIRSDILCAKALDLKSLVQSNYKAGVTTALLSPGSGPVAGISTIVDYTETGTVVTPQAAAELSFRNGGSGAGYPGTLFGVIALLRQTLADAQYYAAQEAPKKDDALENLRPLITGKLPALFSADSAREIVRATRVADEFSLRLLILGGREAYRDLDLLKSKNLPVLVTLDIGDDPTKPTSTPPTPNPDGPPKAVLDERHDTWLDHSLNIKKLSDAGVPFAFTSVGLSAGIDGYLKAIRTIIGTGVPRDVALKAVTSESALLLGISEKVGTIEPGKIANLAVFNGDFADAKSEVQFVLVEGKKVDIKKAGSK